MKRSHRFFRACGAAWERRMEGPIDAASSIQSAIDRYAALVPVEEALGAADEAAFKRIERRIAVAIVAALEASGDDIEAAGLVAAGTVTTGRDYAFRLFKQLNLGVAGYLAHRLEATVVRAASLALVALGRADHRVWAPSFGADLARMREAGHPSTTGADSRLVDAYLEGRVTVALSSSYRQALEREMTERPLVAELVALFSKPDYYERRPPARPPGALALVEGVASTSDAAVAVDALESAPLEGVASVGEVTMLKVG